MVWHAADLQENALLVSNDSTHVLVKPLLNVGRDQASAVFRAVDDMEQKIGECSLMTSGSRPRLYAVAAPRLLCLLSRVLFMLSPLRGCWDVGFLLRLKELAGNRCLDDFV